MKKTIKRKFREAVNGNEDGFSIIELIMVIVITGIVTAIALPKFADVNTVDLYTTARQVKSDIRYTQEMALSKYAIRKIVFAGSNNTYTIKDNLNQIIESKELPKNSKATFNAIGSGTTELVYIFNSSGEPDSTYGAGDTLRISYGSSYKDIEVESISGRATIQ
ncbi:MAG: prepilin-type N-terminal cleavage/methylation domain-containing protein [Candidatus Scalindua sp.]|jgi:prepilin-type N-terminal cleavage/methylation domain-containing protein|nr:prepilin-type N-terminal cleavage/methylation domain-containing protein [Candidatus Scalindua sp.]MBT5305676.1 prepilin-type N-terminal cleavage/methylation domain-containing protein [Candidatus Scalindua sp.]MBT6051212.1 prepilin-type N-terminal cleavage/methylation domain-containing protein [Candidatus Scalindua sp.]MBT6230333.1 prepilin-type N-terminal cleavage/methylation domain-containing protein [Candidatus Scalindua sp.]MBT6564045.1 prepilin-type N-terminal cleavage/methylation domain